MRYSNKEVAHRWVHGLLDSGEICGSNMSGNNYSLYSYSTVIAQCLDRTNRVFVVIDQSLTPTTSKHISYVERAFPSDFIVIRTHIKSQYSYNNVDFLGWDKKFDKEKRLGIVTIFLEQLFSEYEHVVKGNDLNAENISKKVLFDIDRLDRIYGDCSLKEWLRSCKLAHANDRKHKDFKLRRMVRLYLDGRSDAEITDALFGKDTWAKMQKRIAPLKKGRIARERLDALREHMLYSSDRYCYHGRPVCPYNAKELRKLTPRQIIEIRFMNLERINEHNRRMAKYKRSDMSEKLDAYSRACKFIGVSDDRYRSIDKVTKPDGTLVYNSGKYGGFDRHYNVYVHGFADFNDGTKIDFDYNSFCQAPDKFVWRERFYKLCELKMRRLYGAYLYNKKREYEKHSLPFVIDEEQNHILNEYIIRRSHHEAEEAKRKKIEAARRERELQERLERIEAYKNGGYDGIRRLWIEHLESVPADILHSEKLCYGGNILFRFASQKGIIETSLGIRLTFNECHTYWKIIKKWHDTGTFEEGIVMSGYRVNSFENDILRAGCHRIAFCEMQRMYDELCKLEAA